jgi:hypothetical protein
MTDPTIHGGEIMNKQRFIWLALLLAFGLLLPAAPVLADASPPEDDGIVVWNEDYTLEEGERLNGNLVVFNGDVTLEVDSYVNGSVITWNGSAEVEGTVNGDVVVSSGDIYLGDDALVEGNVVCSWNCDLEQAEGARVEGVYTEGDPLEGLQIDPRNGIPIPAIPSPTAFWVSGPGRVFSWGLKLIRNVAAILVVAAVAGLVALIWPDPTAQIGRTLIEAPGQSFGMGLLTSVAATMLIVVLAVTICLSPVAALAALALGAAGLLGWIGIGAVVGERLLRALNVRGIAPLWAAGLGTLVISLIGGGLSSAPCLAPLGWFIIFILGCLGLGAVVLTRLGTTAYVPATGPTYHPSGSSSSPSTSTPVEPTMGEAKEEVEETKASEEAAGETDEA